MEEIIVKIDGKEYKVLIEEAQEGKIKVHCGGEVFEVETKTDIEHLVSTTRKVKEISKTGKTDVTAPLTGIITEVKVKKGSIVKEGEVVVRLIAMKMENEITAIKSGIIKSVNVKKDDKVNKGDVLVVIE